MGLEGRWFMQPGDIPAPFVYMVELDGAGTAKWSGDPALVSAYRIGDGHLVIGWGEDTRIVLNTPDPDADILAGAIETRAVYEEDECDDYQDDEDEDDAESAKPQPGDFRLIVDFAAFVRKPQMLEVVNLPGPIAATAPDFFYAGPRAAR